MRTALYENGLFVNDKFRMENVLPAMGQRPLSLRSQSRVEQAGGGLRGYGLAAPLGLPGSTHWRKTRSTRPWLRRRRRTARLARL